MFTKKNLTERMRAWQKWTNAWRSDPYEKRDKHHNACVCVLKGTRVLGSDEKGR